MALSFDSIQLGQQAGPFKYPVKDHVEAYLKATDNNHDWFVRRSPWGPPIAPPGLLFDATVQMMQQEFGVPPAPVLAEQEVSFRSAVRQDRTIIGYGMFVNKRIVEGRGNLIFEARFRDEVDLIVGHSLLSFSLPNEPAPRLEPQIEKPAEGELVSLVKGLTADRLDAYNPGRPAELVCSDCISDLMFNVFERDWPVSGDMALTFLDTPNVGDIVAASGRVSDRVEQGAVVRTVYTVWCEDQGGRLLAIGTAAAVTPLR
ncbi:MAG TPA: hypothetical protein VFB90_08435 [Dehalococcoidia bacterium]|nr:hypothetical protein [Dehalococcoidia bacterium]